MPRFKLTLEYDGGPFVGWQRQDNGVSVQEALEDAVFAMTGERSIAQGRGGPTRAFMQPDRSRMSILRAIAAFSARRGAERPAGSPCGRRAQGRARGAMISTPATAREPGTMSIGSSIAARR